MAADSVKQIGQVFTPEFMVQQMLDYAGYTAENGILKKHIIDNSCGDGAFLVCVVQRYISAARRAGWVDKSIRLGLVAYIHGVDLDKRAVAACRERLDAVAVANGLRPVRWDIRCQDTMIVARFDGRMHFVVGNPPYVRVHNLAEAYGQVKQFKFAENGMADLYLVFFELGFRMLRTGGVLCYITPSSWLWSVAAREMRAFVLQQRSLVELVDLCHYQLFRGITTYSMVSVFRRGAGSDSFTYYTFNPDTRERVAVDVLSWQDILMDSCFYLADRRTLSVLRQIKTCRAQAVTVKNGFATLADSCFIGDHIPQSAITIPVLKVSTGVWSRGLFPYDRAGQPLPAEAVFADAAVAAHLQSVKGTLLKGGIEQPGWWLYGRTQALSDVWRYKISVNTLMRTVADLKITAVPAGQGLYSGLYIVGDIDIATVRTLLVSAEFERYVKALKMYKSGGYYTFGSKDLQQYLNYRLAGI